MVDWAAMGDNMHKNALATQDLFFNQAEARRDRAERLKNSGTQKKQFDEEMELKKRTMNQGALTYLQDQRLGAGSAARSMPFRSALSQALGA